VNVLLPIWQGRVSPVLDFAGRFLVVEIEGSREIGRREVLIGESNCDALARSLREIHPDVLLCGAISQALEMRLNHSGLRIVSHVCGEIDTVLQAFAAGTLASPEFTLPGCWGRRRGKRCCWRNDRAGVGARQKHGNRMT
jgi:predicted Fe-Mo cluster-binding NifX family protein